MTSYLLGNEVVEYKWARNKQEIGKEAWFHLEVGLPIKSLDHVPDYQIGQMYRSKV
jgi:hypothetical protein